MKHLHKNKKTILALCILLTSICIIQETAWVKEAASRLDEPSTLSLETSSFSEKKYIKWVDFNVSYEALCEAYQWDTDTYKESLSDNSIPHLNWIELLSYTAAHHGGDFPADAAAEIKKIAGKLKKKETSMQELTKDLKYYPYYLEAYTAVLGEFVGNYSIESIGSDGKKEMVDCYGLKAFSPIAKGFEYNDFDDFGTARSYGYSRPHLGHDMMGLVGTPI